jgi:hypothetical protein
MPNISTKGEDILLQSGKTYLVIDVLYINEIKENLNSIDVNNLGSLKKEIFPYSDAPFAIIAVQDGEFFKTIKVSCIKTEKEENCDSSCFVSDTGLIIFLNINKLSDILSHFDYNILVEETEKSVINIPYWLSLEKLIGEYNLGLILSPGINKGFEYGGSGLYKIEL